MGFVKTALASQTPVDWRKNPEQDTLYCGAILALFSVQQHKDMLWYPETRNADASRIYHRTGHNCRIPATG